MIVFPKNSIWMQYDMMAWPHLLHLVTATFIGTDIFVPINQEVMILFSFLNTWDENGALFANILWHIPIFT